MRILYFYLFFISFHCLGQNPHYFTIDKTKGLPSNVIYDVFQDKKGMIWLTTNDGICSYDGKRFTSYTSENQVSKAGSNIVEDALGRIWYCSFDGYIYYVDDGILNSLPQQTPIGYQKFAVLQDNLLYFEPNELIFLNLKTLKPIKKISISTEKLISTHAFNGVFYVYVKEFLYEIEGINSIKKTLIPASIQQKLSVSIVTNTKDKLLLVSKYSNKYGLFNNGGFEVDDFKNTINFIQNAKFTNNYNWISTTKGIVKVDLQNPTEFRRYFEEFNISTILKDKDGNNWIGTLGKGLLLVPDFDTYLIPTSDIPVTIKTYQEKLYISTQNDKILTSTEVNHPFNFKTLYQGVSNHVIEQMTIDSLQQKIYFTSNTFKTIDFNGKLLKETVLATKDFFRIDDTYYGYVSTGSCGLFKVSEKISNWDSLFNSNNIHREEDARFSAIVEGVRGKSVTFNPFNQTIYFATNTGLYAVNSTQKQAIQWHRNPINLTKIVAFKDAIYGLTSGNKLLQIDRNNQVTLIELSLGDENIQKMTLEGTSLVLFTNSSVIKYNLENRSVSKLFNLSADNEISTIAKFKNSYLLGSTKGLIRTDIAESKENPIPEFMIQDILVNGKKKSIGELQNLSKKENSVEILYSVISYISNLKNIVYYKINDGKWQIIDDASRSLKLSILASGNYIISFKTAYENRFSSVQKINVIIHKPFTERMWFYALVTFVMLLLVHFFYRWQIQKIKLRNQLLLDKVELENNLNQSTLKAIKSQMNPHFFYNALNTIQSFILSNEKKQAVNYLSKFSALTRTILELSEKETVTVAEEIKTLQLYLDIEKVRFNEDFEYHISLPEDEAIQQYKMPSLLLQPYVENAIKHGLLHKKGLKTLKLAFKIQENNLEIEVTDDGIGRRKSEELKKLRQNPHQSFATQAMEERINLLNRNKANKISIEIIDLYTEHNQGKGTTVLFKIPLDFYYQ